MVNTLGLKIKDYVVAKGIPQSWISNMIGCHYNTVNRFLNGRENPRDSVIIRICELIGIDYKLAWHHGIIQPVKIKNEMTQNRGRPFYRANKYARSKLNPHKTTTPLGFKI